MKINVKSSGFTLIETLIALIILSFALLALAGLMVTTTRNNSAGGQMTVAATLAQDKLEELRATPFDNIQDGTDEKIGSHGIKYGRTWALRPPPDTGPNLKTIAINVAWTDKSSHSIRIISAVNR